MTTKIAAQIHLWPWSLGIPDETVNLSTGNAIFPFYGSPVISVSTSASLYLPRRHEKFIALGPSFEMVAGGHQLYEMPHGCISSRNYTKQEASNEINVVSKNNREMIQLLPQGAKKRYLKTGGDPSKKEETELARLILAWSQMFDDMLEESKKVRNDQRLSWQAIEEKLKEISEERTEPRKALIVDIAERLHERLSLVVQAARKILLRERRLLAAGRVVETDSTCLRWLVRQPGESIAEKAAVNNQRLLGVFREESFNTLENMVLKDFIWRCSHEGRRYLNMEIGNRTQFINSRRAQLVRAYRHLCSELYQVPHFMHVGVPPTPIRPNYVLQNDYRYKEVWRQYLRLLRREDEEDCLWDWQSRTWADVSRLLVSAALYRLSQTPCDALNTKVEFQQLLSSDVHFLTEQKLGCRTASGSEPGPFLINRCGVKLEKGYILEIVHPDMADKHSGTKQLGRLGGHLYLVLTPLSGGSKLIIVVWSVHTASTMEHPGWYKISKSAGRALTHHMLTLHEMREPNPPILRGFVLASDLESICADIYPGGDDGLDIVKIAADQRCWEDAIEGGIALVLEEILKKAI